MALISTGLVKRASNSKLVAPSRPTYSSYGYYAEHLRQHMRTLHGGSPGEQWSSGYIPAALNNATVVFIGAEAFRSNHLRPIRFS